jgi:hypothetical protein
MTMSGFESAIAAPIKHNELKMLYCSKSFKARCFKGQGNAWGNNMTDRTALAGKNKLASTILLSDQRGAVAFEMPFVLAVLILSLLLPLADVAIAGFQFLSARGALRAFGQYLQYNQPSDVMDTSNWIKTVHSTANAAGISDPVVVCGDNTTGCSDASLLPKYYSYSKTVTLAPMVVTALCSGQASPCTYTLFYSERFQ